MYCKEKCGGPVKPKIIFYGEELSKSFLKVLKEAKNKCDLLIVMGTALGVAPFNQMVNKLDDICP